MEIQIRRAIPEDAASLAAVEVASWRAAYRGLMPDAFLDGLAEAELSESWHQNLLKYGSAGRKRALVALADQRIVGFVRVGIAWDEGEVGLVYLLYVLPQYWGCGVGKALMSAAMDELRDLRTNQAVLWVLRDNQRARCFYERLGWQPDGRTDSAKYGNTLLQALCYRQVVAQE